MALTFAEAMRQIREESVEAMTALIRQSAQDIEHEASRTRGEGGRLPVDTSFLRNSVVVTTDGSIPGATGVGLTREQRKASLGNPNTEAALANAELGGVIMITWTAYYAAYVEHNAMFVRGAIEMWDAIVENNARELAGRLTRRGR